MQLAGDLKVGWANSVYPIMLQFINKYYFLILSRQIKKQINFEKWLNIWRPLNWVSFARLEDNWTPLPPTTPASKSFFLKYICFLKTFSLIFTSLHTVSCGIYIILCMDIFRWSFVLVFGFFLALLFTKKYSLSRIFCLVVITDIMINVVV